MPNYNKYEPELKEKVLRLYLEEGRTKKSLTEERPIPDLPDTAKLG